MKIDHIGYLSKNIQNSAALFKTLGFEQVTEIITDDKADENSKARNVYLCFLENAGVRVELVSPIDETSDVYKTLQRQGEGPYHICYRVPELASAMDRLMEEKWIVIKKPAPAVAFDNARVAFLFKNGVGMIELVEDKI